MCSGRADRRVATDLRVAVAGLHDEAVVVDAQLAAAGARVDLDLATAAVGHDLEHGVVLHDVECVAAHVVRQAQDRVL